MARGPVDPRLLTHASASRTFFVFGAAVGVVQTLSIIAFAWGAASAISGDPMGVAVLAGGILVRAVSVWLLDLLSARGAARVTSQLRMRVVASISALGPEWLSTRNRASVATVAGPGLDALDGYFSKYLPQLILTAVSVPILLLVVFTQDLTTFIIVLATLPLIPLFMVLIGWATQAVQRQQWTALTALATGFLEVVEGLSTLSIFGRQHRQAKRIEAVTEEYRTRTMAVLRVSFISGFVLELAGSLSVAVVAVSIGVRLIDGSLPLFVGLFVLLITPEIYLPIRQVGVQFHAAADGVAAAEDVFEIVEAAPKLLFPTDAPRSAAASVGNSSMGVLALDLTVRGIPFRGEFAPGSLSVIAAPSGSGKSSVIAALLGFASYEGSVAYGGSPLEPGAARDLVAWAGQRPALAAGTVADNVALGAADPALLVEAMRLAGATSIPIDRVLGVGGAGLSGGQGQRVAVARAMYRMLHHDCPILVLDEPTSALDEAAETAVLAGVREAVAQGRVVIVVSHRAEVIAAADTVVRVGALV